MNVAEFFLKKGFLASPEFVEGIKGVFFINDECFEANDFIVKNFNFKRETDDKEEYNEYDDLTLVKEEKLVNNIDLTMENDLPKALYKDKGIKIVRAYRENPVKKEIRDFIGHFKLRFNFLKNLLLNREELQNTLSISKILDKKTREGVSVIGFVKDKRVNKTGSVVLTLEDVTGEIDVFFNKNLDFLDSIKDIVFDEVIGINGVFDGRFVYANKIFFPDVPVINELKKYDKEEYTVFTSDVHVGNKFFYENNFAKFIKWLNLEHGNERQKEIARKVKYVFFLGDLADGIGVYPDQEEDLVIKDIYEQYELFVKYVNSIRKDIIVVLICGNHDAVRLTEPQPILDKKFAPDLFKNENIVFTTNPSVVNICSSDNFPGFNILMYHGYSFTFYSEDVDSIRKNGRLERVDLIMKFLMQKRHLAPSHGSNTYIPDINEDHLIIDMVPDFFASGHIHKTMAVNYKGITLLNCGCWIGQTEDQERRGIVPDPNRIIAVNLQTREVKILNFEE